MNLCMYSTAGRLLGSPHANESSTLSPLLPSPVNQPQSFSLRCDTAMFCRLPNCRNHGSSDSILPTSFLLTFWSQRDEGALRYSSSLSTCTGASRRFCRYITTGLSAHLEACHPLTLAVDHRAACSQPARTSSSFGTDVSTPPFPLSRSFLRLVVSSAFCMSALDIPTGIPCSLAGYCAAAHCVTAAAAAAAAITAVRRAAVLWAVGVRI